MDMKPRIWPKNPSWEFLVSAQVVTPILNVMIDRKATNLSLMLTVVFVLVPAPEVEH